MRELKDDLRTIIDVITFGLLYLSFSIIDYPILSYIFLGLWTAYWTWNIYSKIQYRKGKAQYILIPTINDDYSKMTSIILGFILFSLAIILWLWKPEIFNLELILLIVGLLLFINGLLDLPKGKIELQENFLSITGFKGKINVKDIKSLEIMTNKIILVDNTAKTTRFDNFNIDINSAIKIENYFAENCIGREFAIKNNLC
ncbi:hypothetical protein H9N25_02675 [Pedobacter riviphilus]|uniref:Uncharacterized protein n=1 Tax=Pedobacter riviphilus TaxID=2766984 RepID=A0ABX6TKH3_9SPHI|nr:hypothetical protein [Pedobacter riviphilus]QNR85406.1 hypothetical protein H9N25_02675 [Pedobacter riviphilus]